MNTLTKVKVTRISTSTYQWRKHKEYTNNGERYDQAFHSKENVNRLSCLENKTVNY